MVRERVGQSGTKGCVFGQDNTGSVKRDSSHTVLHLHTGTTPKSTGIVGSNSGRGKTTGNAHIEMTSGGDGKGECGTH